MSEHNRYIAFVIDGPVGHDTGRFVELENDRGEGISLGEWVQRGTYWELRVPDPRGEYERGLRAALAAVRGEPGLEDTELYSNVQRDVWQARAIADVAAIERLLEQTKGDGNE